MENQVVCDQGILLPTFEEETSFFKAALVGSLARGTYRVLSAGPAEHK